jgi:glycosyltransferase involved in cell wall biosynthesis
LSEARHKGVLDSLSVVILTFNEAPNIERTLSALSWAGDIVVVDSLSTDLTVEIARRFPAVRIFSRPFDTHAKQWNFALQETGMTSEWVLALDADYQVPAGLVEELRALAPPDEVAGLRAQFIYCVNGVPLGGTLYPPVTVCFRRTRSAYVQDGHTQRIQVDGAVRDLESRLLHDDRKPLSRWLSSQERYMRLEAAKIRSTPFSALRTADRVRKLRVVAPLLVLLYCLFGKRLVLNGWAGVHYTLQRVVAEAILSLCMIEGDLLEVSRPKSEKSQ